MAIRRAGNMFEVLSSGESLSLVRNDSPLGRGPVLAGAGTSNQVQSARVVSVGSAITVIEWQGHFHVAAQATDEPLRAGQQVWVASTKDGRALVLGSKK